MTNKGVIIFGDSILRKKALQVVKIDDRIRDLSARMFEVMKKARGVGLAANQVGALDRLVVIDTNRGETKGHCFTLINPELIGSKGEVKLEEGCLSFPDISAEVERPEKVGFSATGLDGKRFEFEADGILGRAVQHEIDHLNGVLFIDHLGITKKMLLKKQLEELKKLSKKS